MGIRGIKWFFIFMLNLYNFSKNFQSLCFSLFFSIFIFQFFNFPRVKADEVSSTLTWNQTLGIKVEAKIFEKESKIEINYTIIEALYGDSRQGIFISLPKDQDGIWTDYKIMNVKRSDPQDYTSFSRLDFAKSSDLGFKNKKQEPYKKILEHNQLRLRVGQAGKHLEKGVYEYNIKLEATYKPDLSYNFSFISNWVGGVPELALKVNDQFICTSFDNKNCLSDTAVLNLNPDKDKLNLASLDIFYSSFFWSFYNYFSFTLFLYFVIFLLYLKFAKDPSEGHFHKKPEFEPPEDLLPWQAQYLINEGAIDLKNTFLSYLLYLNYKKIIEFKPKNQENLKSDKKPEMELVIKDIIPSFDSIPNNKFQLTIQEIARNGIKKGFENAKLSQDFTDTLNYVVQKSVEEYYKVIPFNDNWTTPVSVYFGVIFIISLFSELIQNIFLVGDSIFNLAFFAWTFAFPGMFWLSHRWGILKNEFYSKRAYCVRYKYYLENAEKEKLDFSNNPDEGIQYYLKAVPYAASFGILKKFNSYMQKLIPNQNQELIKSTNLYSNLLLNSSLYVPPSSGGGGGFSGGGGSFSSGGFSGGGGSW
jgi:uncharacterized membrane protein YgcG